MQLAIDIQPILDELQRSGKLPAQLPQSTIDAMAKSMRRYAQLATKQKIKEFTEMAKDAVESELKTMVDDRGVTIGSTPAEARKDLLEFLEDNNLSNLKDTMNMDFFLRIPQEVAEGAGRYMVQNYDQVRVDEFPALELVRVFDREIPRGEKMGKHGVIVPDPENGWDVRWEAAANDAGDILALKVFKETGRMVALKDSDIWQSLGDGAGGYEDTLGNPYAPFAFNSGMETEEVSREDAVDLGLMDDNDEAKGASVDFKDLLAFEARDWSRVVKSSMNYRLLASEKSEEMAVCPKCNWVVNITKEPEISMSAICCPNKKCKATITQAHMADFKKRNK